MTDEQFTEATGGLQKDDLHSLLVGMRKIKDPDPFAVTGNDGNDEIVRLKSGNIENGDFIPVLSIETEEVSTTLRSFPGSKCAVTVIDRRDGTEISGSLITKKGTEEQDPEVFKLIPDTHWRALRYAKAEIDRQNPSRDNQVKHRGRLLGRIITGKHYLRLPK